MTQLEQQAVIAIVGPTGVGKTSAAINLAKQNSLELVSADSRQLYRGMDIGTGKEVDKGQWYDINKRPTLVIDGIRIHGLNLTTPDQPFSIAQWHHQIATILDEIHQRGQRPLIVGGTGFYLQALQGKVATMSIPPDQQLRQQLSSLTTLQLFEKLQQRDPTKANTLNNSDRHNPARLIRLIEILNHQPNPQPPSSPVARRPSLSLHLIGLTMPRQHLHAKVDRRIDQMVDQGLIKEVQNLIDRYDPQLQAFKTIGYQEIIQHLQGHISLEQALQQIKHHTHHYIRRQQTWFKKQPVQWIDVDQSDWLDRLQSACATATDPNQPTASS